MHRSVANPDFASVMSDTILHFYLIRIHRIYIRYYIDTLKQCCGSGMIYSGSSFEFLEFRIQFRILIRIQAKLPDPDPQHCFKV